MQTETTVQTETEPDQDFQGRERLKLSLFTVYYPEEYAKGEIDTATIGNAEYAVMPENDSGRCTYMYRHEQSGTSYDIRVEGEAASDSVKELLEGVVM